MMAAHKTEEDRDKRCDRRHWAFGTKLVLALVGGMIATVLSLGTMFASNQAAIAEKLDTRVRTAEQFQAATTEALKGIREDIRDIKVSLKNHPAKTP